MGVMGKRLEVRLPWPPSVNHYWKAHGSRRFISKAARTWLDEAILLLRAPGVRFERPVKVSLLLSPPDRRKRDGDNLEKAIMDALVKAGVIRDDSLWHVPRSCRELVGEYEGYVLLVVEEMSRDKSTFISARLGRAGKEKGSCRG
jgi:crossover junction endodeoxyribonuclease RusA